MAKDTIKNYHKMLCPSFISTDSDKQFTLADLSVTGYSPSTPGTKAWSGGCGKNQFLLKVLKQNGTLDAVYGWADATTGKIESPTVLARGWYQLTGSTFTTWPTTPMTDAEMKAVAFDSGKAFWVKGSLAGIQLQSNGAVKDQDTAIDTVKNYHVAAGNGMAQDLTLGDLYVTGYTASTPGTKAWSGGCGKNQFLLKVLKQNGTLDAVYGWADATTGKIESPTVLARGWYKLTGSTFTTWPTEPMTAEEMAAVKVEAGQGYWIKGSIAGLQLYVPAPEL